MKNYLRTTWENEDFQKLIIDLDVYLAEKDGDEHPFYAQYNKIENLDCVMVVYDHGTAIACGVIKPYDSKTIEIKRMYVVPEARCQGVASQILVELEKWAKELLFERSILETGAKQKEAILLYQKNNYVPIVNYGQYAGVENSFCFEKKLS